MTISNRQAEIDQNDVVLRMFYLKRWHGSPAERQQEIVDALRTLVEQCPEHGDRP